MRHHTKDKGDLAVGQVIADLWRVGAHVCLPISEHLPFDLIALSPSMRAVRRVQVKYVSARDGSLRLSLRNTHTDRRGIHYKTILLDEIDAFAIFCPDANKVYYVLREEIPSGVHRLFSLRLARSKNGQTKHIKPAKQFLGADRLFGPVAQRIEQRPSKSLVGGSIPSGPATDGLQTRVL